MSTATVVSLAALEIQGHLRQRTNLRGAVVLRLDTVHLQLPATAGTETSTRSNTELHRLLAGCDARHHAHAVSEAAPAFTSHVCAESLGCTCGPVRAGLAGWRRR